VAPSSPRAPRSRGVCPNPPGGPPPPEGVGRHEEPRTGVPQPRADGVDTVAGEERQHDAARLHHREKGSHQLRAHRHEKADAIGRPQPQRAKAVRALVGERMQVAVGQRAGDAFLALPPQRRAIGGRRALPFVEAAADDVHSAADAPARPGRTAAEIENSFVRHVELDADLVEHGAPEPFRFRHRARQQRVVRDDAVRVHERLHPALIDVLGRGTPDDLAVEDGVWVRH
jgi:hypothetical protein